ncbi:hypothetical protein PoB_003652500 [Plakobranchus ocellatus]|uniref:Uncharacterized protein n=1 Tax=Plakobranchus ocellatus TaxID=259542 RepID=A0AAV4AT07_9GAST|nr:hypothetical protein PoB_003652500 [Plakobranchus ocellatus]
MVSFEFEPATETSLYISDHVNEALLHQYRENLMAISEISRQKPKSFDLGAKYREDGRSGKAAFYIYEAKEAKRKEKIYTVEWSHPMDDDDKKNERHIFNGEKSRTLERNDRQCYEARHLAD